MPSLGTLPPTSDKLVFIMLAVFLLVAVCGVSGQVILPDSDRTSGPPPYIQSTKAFTHARIYIEQRVPYEERNMTEPHARTHFAFGILAEVTRILVREYLLQQPDNYDPMSLLYETVPRAWENYNIVSNTINGLLLETYNNIRVITNKIDTLCRSAETVEECNYRIKEYVDNGSYHIKQRARLLLALAAPAKTLRDHEDELNFAARTYTVVPYLVDRVEGDAYQDFIANLAHVALLLREELSH